MECHIVKITINKLHVNDNFYLFNIYKKDNLKKFMFSKNYVITLEEVNIKKKKKKLIYIESNYVYSEYHTISYKYRKRISIYLWKYQVNFFVLESKVAYLFIFLRMSINLVVVLRRFRKIWRCFGFQEKKRSLAYIEYFFNWNFILF